MQAPRRKWLDRVVEIGNERPSGWKIGAQAGRDSHRCVLTLAPLALDSKSNGLASLVEDDVAGLRPGNLAGSEPAKHLQADEQSCTGISPGCVPELGGLARSESVAPHNLYVGKRRVGGIA